MRFSRCDWRGLLATLAAVAVLALCFAMTEIQIEGAAGWAANLPTWRIEGHWLLDIFWSGRTLTGYHAWVFAFMALMFHFPFVLLQRWSVRWEARAIGSLMLFWVIEDFLWFALNPAYGLARFDALHIPWHRHWWGPAPGDYWVSLPLALLLLLWSFSRPRGANS